MSVLNQGAAKPGTENRMSPLNAWAFSFACAIGWAAFVMPGTFFLPKGGFWGSILAFAVATFSICVIALNYHFLGNLHKGPGGIYRLVHLSLNRGHAFAAAWGMGLAHMCCFSLNARALAMLVRTIIEETFKIDFEFYLIPGNTLLFDFVVILAFLYIFAKISIRGIRRLTLVQTVGAIVLLAGIVIMLVASHKDGVHLNRIPSLESELKGSFTSGFMAVFILTPWAYVGFDSLSKIHKEITFPKKRLGLIMIIAVCCATFAYVANIITAIAGIDTDPSAWNQHLDIVSQSPGASAFPVALAAEKGLGAAGFPIFYISCLSAAITGLIGFSVSSSRLIFQMAQDHVLPNKLGETDPKYGTPRNAIRVLSVLAVLLILLLNSFSFIEELASISTALGYGYLSYSAFRMARREKKPLYMATGLIGLLFCVLWIVLMLGLIPAFSDVTAISPRAISSIAVWAFLGIASYSIFSKENREPTIDSVIES